MEEKIEARTIHRHQRKLELEKTEAHIGMKTETRHKEERVEAKMIEKEQRTAEVKIEAQTLEVDMERGVQRWIFNAAAWSPSPHEFSSCLSLLPGPQRSEITRYIKFEDQKRALISRLMQRMLVQSLLGIPSFDVIIQHTKEGKPYLANALEKKLFPNFNFNVSHHGDLVALASEPLCLVGLDVMAHEPSGQESPEQFVENFTSCFTELEWANIKSAGCRPGPLLDQFYRYWCMKEAYIKAVGIGLGFELKRAEFYYPKGNIWSDVAYLRIDGQDKINWRFNLHRLNNYHWACVARGPPAEAVESFRKTLHQVDFDNATLTAALELKNKPFMSLSITDLVLGLKGEGCIKA